MTDLSRLVAAARVLVPAACLSLAAPAAAQGPSDLDARTKGKALYDDGVRLMAAGKVAEACPRFESALGIDPGRLGVMMKLAGCYEAAGRVASAKTAYDLAEAGAAKAGDARAADAHARSVDLAPRVPRLTIAVAAALAPVAGLAVQRDDGPVERALWGVPIPVDPGEHLITASAPGKKPWRGVVKLAERDTKSIEIPALAPEEARAPTPPAPPTPGAPLVPPAPPPPAPGSIWSATRVAGVVVGAAGVVGAGVGAAFGAIALQKKNASNADGHCAGNLCDGQGVGLRSDSIAAGNASTALFAVGGALVATGVVLIAIAPRKRDASVAIGPTGVTLQGRW